MRFNHYTDNTAALAADLVNLWVAEPVKLDDVKAVLRAHHVSGGLRRADVDDLGGVARGLAQVFAAPSTSAAAAVLNALLAPAPVSPHISEHDGEDAHLHFAAPTASLVERLRCDTAMALAVVLCDYGRERLGRCAADGCERVFVDTSRNASRRYCSDAHANRANVAAFRARRAGDGP
jgi:hypothetical protein